MELKYNQYSTNSYDQGWTAYASGMLFDVKESPDWKRGWWDARQEYRQTRSVKKIDPLEPYVNLDI